MENGLNGMFVLKIVVGVNIIGYIVQFDYGINIYWMKDLLRCKVIKLGVFVNKGVINIFVYFVIIYNMGIIDLYINDKFWVLLLLIDKVMQIIMFEGNVFLFEVYEKIFIQVELL